MEYNRKRGGLFQDYRLRTTADGLGNGLHLSELFAANLLLKEQTVILAEDKEKKVMVRRCTKIVADTDLYETDKEVQSLIDRVCLSEQIKENNNIIRNLTGEYKKIGPDCREGVRAQLERMKGLCIERNSLYERQNDLKG